MIYANIHTDVRYVRILYGFKVLLVFYVSDKLLNAAMERKHYIYNKTTKFWRNISANALTSV